MMCQARMHTFIGLQTFDAPFISPLWQFDVAISNAADILLVADPNHNVSFDAKQFTCIHAHVLTKMCAYLVTCTCTYALWGRLRLELLESEKVFFP